MKTTRDQEKYCKLYVNLIIITKSRRLARNLSDDSTFESIDSEFMFSECMK